MQRYEKVEKIGEGQCSQGYFIRILYLEEGGGRVRELWTASIACKDYLHLFIVIRVKSCQIEIRFELH